MPSVLRIVLLALAALAVLAPAAEAALAPSVTAQLTDEGVEDGRRTVRVDVGGTCGPAAAPGTTVYVDAGLRRAPAGPGAKAGTPFYDGYDVVGPVEAVEGTSATFRFRVSGGWNAVAVGSISCYEQESGDTAELESQPTAAVLAPLRLDGWEARAASVNGGPRCAPPLRGKLRAHNGYDLAFDLAPIDARTVFGHPGTEPRMSDLGKIRFHLRGGGTRKWDKPVSKRGFSLYRQLLMGYYYQPRKPRPVTMWLTVDGVETNRLTVRVQPRKKGCRKL